MAGPIRRAAAAVVGPSDIQGDGREATVCLDANVESPFGRTCVIASFVVSGGVGTAVIGGVGGHGAFPRVEVRIARAAAHGDGQVACARRNRDEILDRVARGGRKTGFRIAVEQLAAVRGSGLRFRGAAAGGRTHADCEEGGADIRLVEAQIARRVIHALRAFVEGGVGRPVALVGLREKLESRLRVPAGGGGQKIEGLVVDAAGVVDIHAFVVVARMPDGLAVLRRIVHVAQGRVRLLEDVAAEQPVVGTLHVVFGRLARHVGVSLVHAAGLAAVHETGILFGETVADLVGGHVKARKRIKVARPVAEGHGRSVPERVLVAAAVVDAHGELEGQRRNSDPVLKHVVDHAAEIMGVVERRIGAVDFLVGVHAAGKGKGGGTAGAVVEVDRLHVGVVHHVAGSVKRREIRAVFVATGFLVAAGARARGQTFELLEDFTGLGVDQPGRTGGVAAADSVLEEGNFISQAGAFLGRIHHQVGPLVAVFLRLTGKLEVFAPAELFLTAALVLALHQSKGVLGGKTGFQAFEFLSQALEQLAVEPHNVATTIFRDNDMLAPNGDAVVGLLQTGVHQPAFVGMGTQGFHTLGPEKPQVS